MAIITTYKTFGTSCSVIISIPFPLLLLFSLIMKTFFIVLVGNYTCVAVNDVGEDKHSTQMIIHGNYDLITSHSNTTGGPHGRSQAFNREMP